MKIIPALASRWGGEVLGGQYQRPVGPEQYHGGGRGGISTGGIDIHSTEADTLSDLSLGYGHSCGILEADGTVICWGLNNSGQLGAGNTDEVGDDSTRPVTGGSFLNLGNLLEVTAGGTQTCAIDRNYRIRCWGDNGSGQLGYGDTNDRGDDSSEVPDASWPTLVF